MSDARIKSREIKGLTEAAKKFKAKKGKIITENYYSEEKINGVELKFIPLWRWLLELGG